MPMSMRDLVLSLAAGGFSAATAAWAGTHDVSAAAARPANGIHLVADEAAATAKVTIDNFTFSPATLTVAPGTKVTWVNHDDVPHTVTSSEKPRRFASKAMDTDEQFSHVFDTPGTYAYFCAVHPHMTGKIIVK